MENKNSDNITSTITPKNNSTNNHSNKEFGYIYYNNLSADQKLKFKLKSYNEQFIIEKEKNSFLANNNNNFCADNEKSIKIRKIDNRNFHNKQILVNNNKEKSNSKFSSTDLDIIKSKKHCKNMFRKKTINKLVNYSQSEAKIINNYKVQTIMNENNQSLKISAFKKSIGTDTDQIVITNKNSHSTVPKINLKLLNKSKDIQGDSNLFSEQNSLNNIINHQNVSLNNNLTNNAISFHDFNENSLNNQVNTFSNKQNFIKKQSIYALNLHQEERRILENIKETKISTEQKIKMMFIANRLSVTDFRRLVNHENLDKYALRIKELSKESSLKKIYSDIDNKVILNKTFSKEIKGLRRDFFVSMEKMKNNNKKLLIDLDRHQNSTSSNIKTSNGRFRSIKMNMKRVDQGKSVSLRLNKSNNASFYNTLNL